MSRDVVDLLRDVPLPDDPFDRYAGVVAHRRTGDRRRYAVLGASLVTVLAVGAVAAVSLQPRPETADAASVLSASPTTARTELRIGSGAQEQVATGLVDFAHHASVLLARGPFGVSETRQIGLDMWVKTPGFAIAAGKPWTHSVRRAKSSSSLSFASPDADEVLTTLRTRGKLTRVGPAEVRGEATSEYTARIDKAQEVEVFVDDQGRARRFRVTITLPSGPVTLQQDLFDFGVAVDVTPPPADQVAEAPPSTCVDSTPDPNGLVTTRCSGEVHLSGGSGQLTPEQKQLACASFDRGFAEVLKTHPEQKAAFEKARQQVCGG